MARSRLHNCAFKAIDPTETRPADDDGYLRGLTHCGSTSYFMPKARERGAQVRASCPKCAAAMGKLRLAQHGARVRLEPAPDDMAKRFKSAWTIYIDGVARGYVATERGFGKGWALYSMADEKRLSWCPHGGRVSGTRPSEWQASTYPADNTFQPIHYGARDAMACAAVKAAERGMLPTAEEAEAQRLAEVERRAQRAAEDERAKAEYQAKREQEEEERSARKAVALLGLAELDKRTDLSNLERAAIGAALTICGSYA